MEPFTEERVVVDAENPGQSGVRLPPSTRDLQITYTAPSFVAPRKVRFRYRLEGHDAGWVEAPNSARQHLSEVARLAPQTPGLPRRSMHCAMSASRFAATVGFRSLR